MTRISESIDRRAAAWGALWVVAANALYLRGLSAVVEPVLSMDPYYIAMAKQPLASLLREDLAWGPLYALWLKPLVAILGDPLAVYAANIAALSVGTSLLIYCHILLLTRRVLLAVATAVFFVTSDLNVPLYSKVNGFALMLVIGGMTAASLVRPGAPRLTVAAMGVLLASHARPELYPGALCLAAAALVRRDRQDWQWPAAGLLAILALALTIGTPLSSESDRLLMAFREHFAWNWTRWHGDGPSMFAIWEQEFGDAASLWQAWQHNPWVIGRHLAGNLVGAAGHLLTATFDHFPVFASPASTGLVRAERLTAAIIGWALPAAVALRANSRLRLARHAPTLVIYGVIAACSVASAIVIYPSPHYLNIAAAMLILASSLSAAVLIPTGPRWPWPWWLVAGLATYLAVPQPFASPPSAGAIALRRPITDTIHFIRGLPLRPPTNVLSADDGLAELLGEGFREVKLWQLGDQPLSVYLHDRDVGLIVNLQGGHRTLGIDDPYWKLLQTQPERAGFVRLPVPGHDRIGLFVRRDRLAR